MWFRSNAGRWFDVHRPVDNFVSSPQVSDGAASGFPQAVHRAADAELLWLTGSESPIDRKTLLGELYAERHGLPWKRKQR
jgi:hypothetical protein